MAANDADGPTDDHLDTEAERERLLSRRDALVGGAAGLSAVALSSQISGFVDTVTAQVQEDNRQMWLGQRFVADASGDDVRLVHQATGQELRYDESTGVVSHRDNPITVGENPWEIQVNGDDGDGIINLQTGELPSASVAVRDSGSFISSYSALDFGTNLDVSEDSGAAVIDASLSGNFASDPHGNEAHDPNFAESGHDNTEHSAAFVSDGDGTQRQIWVIANGASDPSGAGAEDIIFEEEA